MIVVESFHHINIPTADLQKSIEFYTMFLDFELVDQLDDLAYVRFDNLTVRLQQSDAPIGAATNESLALFSFILDVDDFTEALQEIEAKEIKIAAGPEETSDGEKVLITDPSGTLLELFYRE